MLTTLDPIVEHQAKINKYITSYLDSLIPFHAQLGVTYRLLVYHLSVHLSSTFAVAFQQHQYYLQDSMMVKIEFESVIPFPDHHALHFTCR
jgi:hypothetical protein